MQTGTIVLKINLKTRWMYPILAIGCIFLTLAWFPSVRASEGTASLNTWFVDMSRYTGAAHGTLSCEECHGSMAENGIEKKKYHPDPGTASFLKTQTRRIFNYQACQKCHKSAYARFLNGEHATAAAKEKTTGKPSKTGFAPNCGDCHSAHYSKSHLSRAQTGKSMTKTCGTCHPEQKQSFLANYHGRAAVTLGYDKAAFCTDCHGAHTTRSLKDKQVALKACQRCHSDATAEFANIIIHDTTRLDLKNKTKKSSLKWVHWLSTLSLLFIVVVLVFFYLHTGLLMLRKLHEKLRRHK